MESARISEVSIWGGFQSEALAAPATKARAARRHKRGSGGDRVMASQLSIPQARDPWQRQPRQPTERCPDPPLEVLEPSHDLLPCGIERSLRYAQ